MNSNSFGRTKFCALRRALLFGLLIAFSPPAVHADVVAEESFDYPELKQKLASQPGGSGWHAGQGWKTSHAAVLDPLPEGLRYAPRGSDALGSGAGLVVRGTGDRNNPLRRQLRVPFAGDELFVRFLFRYQFAPDAPSQPPPGRFAVLWLDEIDGGDGAGHNQFVPNLGVHVPESKPGQAKPGAKTRFMVRIGTNKAALTEKEVEHDRTYLIVGRLSKTGTGAAAPFDRLQIWIDPDASQPNAPPDAEVRQRTFPAVRWLGVSTGIKTKPGDRLAFDELVLGESWQDVLPASVVTPPEPAAPMPPAKPVRLVDFREEIYPILRDRCFDCHQGWGAESGHRLDLRSELLGHTQGKALAIPGDSANSPLIQSLVTDDEEARMPQYDDALPEDEIALLKAWIDQGLAWDAELLPEETLTSDHWAFQPIKRPAVPTQPDGAAFASPIDAFIHAEQMKAGVTPAPPADWRTLARRAKLDLVGLPPTPEEVAALAEAKSPGFYAQWIEQLLNSPQHGERWGRHWLDLARWAESQGHQQNRPRPHAWRYRDYVVDSFARDRPFDEFLRQQIAGDELLPYRDENIIATGFLAATRYSDNELDKTIQRNDILVDVVNATSTSLLSLTMECSQCHNHKFDPITARDYYRFYAFFQKAQPNDVVLRGDDAAEDPVFTQAIAQQKEIFANQRVKMVAALRNQGAPNAEIAVLTKGVVASLKGDDKQRFDQIAQQIASRQQTWAFYSPVTSATPLEVPLYLTRWPLPDDPELLRSLTSHVLVRGEPHDKGPAVEPGWPEIFGPVPKTAPLTERPRTVLADWLTSRDNPLTARVWVNRIWLYHFGQGLVPTVDNFGTQGQPPTHPELLDWLASELIESGWSTRHIHRLIMLSETYRQSSQSSAANSELDLDNKLYWRWLPRRLEGETIRDSVLAVAGTLDLQVGGPSVSVEQRDKSRRRSLYLTQRRDELPALQALFDGPSATVSCGQRRTSTVPLQSLHLMNNPFIFEQAQQFAARVTREAGDDLTRRIERAYQLTLSRAPDEAELQRVRAFFDDKESKQTGDQRFIHFCHAMLNLNEFVYLP